MRNKRALFAVVSLTVGVLLTACQGVTTSTTSAPATVQATAGCPTGMKPDVNGVCNPGGKTPATPTQKASVQLTASQQQAVNAAQGYLNDGQGFSYNGLMSQLTSTYGEGFNQADAKFAIGYVHPDWDSQAVMAAKGYLADGQGFSRAGLIDQLTSSYGDGFTQAQAIYAVNKVGL